MAINAMIYVEAILHSLSKAFEFTSNEGRRLALDFHDCREVEMAELSKHRMLSSKSDCQHLKLVFDPGDNNELQPFLIWEVPAGPYSPEFQYCGRDGYFGGVASLIAKHFPMGHVNWQKLQGQTNVRAEILRNLYFKQTKLLKALADYKKILEMLSSNKVDFEGFRFDFLPEDYLGDKKEQS